METIKMIFEIVGALGLFLYGMKVMSDGIQKAAGETLQNVLNRITTNRVAAVFTGIIVTAIIQSSSATTVMVVSFVNAGLLSLVQAIGVIMGANIGTTITGWIVSLVGFKLKISAMALPSVGIGLIMFFSKRDSFRNWGEFLIGFGLLFLGLDFLKNAVPTIESDMMTFLAAYTDNGIWSILLFVIVGAILTIVVHSSSASMAIVLTMAHNGLIDLPVATAMILGGNIGTTIDAFLASINTTVNARRAARVHLLFNVVGVALAIAVFNPFIRLIESIVPGNDITTILAAAHTVFNITNTLIFLPFVNKLAALVERVIQPGAQDIGKGTYQLEYFSARLQDTPEINLLKAKREILHMAEVVETMFNKYLDITLKINNGHNEALEELKSMEDFTDQMQMELRRYLVECSRDNLSDSGHEQVTAFLRIINELESIGDSVYNLALLVRRQAKKKIILHATAEQELEPYMAKVQQFLAFIKDQLAANFTVESSAIAFRYEKEINKSRNQLKKQARNNLIQGEDVQGELIFIDTLRHLEHMGDYCLNIAQALLSINGRSPQKVY